MEYIEKEWKVLREMGKAAATKAKQLTNVNRRVEW